MGLVAINAMVATRDYADAIRTAVAAGVDAVVSGAGLPLELPGLVGTKEVAIAPIVSSARAAKLILRRWAKGFDRTADFVVIEGCKAGGHLGFAEEDLLADRCQTLDEILPGVLAEVKPYEEQFGHAIPVFVAGGVYTGADMAHYTGLAPPGCSWPPGSSPPTSATPARPTRTCCWPQSRRMCASSTARWECPAGR